MSHRCLGRASCLAVNSQPNCICWLQEQPQCSSRSAAARRLQPAAGAFNPLGLVCHCPPPAANTLQDEFEGASDEEDDMPEEEEEEDEEFLDDDDGFGGVMAMGAPPAGFFF